MRLRHSHRIRIFAIAIDRLLNSGRSTINSTMVGTGGDTVGNPHRAQISQFEFFELVSLIEIRRTVLYRAIRADCISVNSILPPPSLPWL